jgi:hypothetical protein
MSNYKNYLEKNSKLLAKQTFNEATKNAPVWAKKMLAKLNDAFLGAANIEVHYTKSPDLRLRNLSCREGGQNFAVITWQPQKEVFRVRLRVSESSLKSFSYTNHQDSLPMFVDLNELDVQNKWGDILKLIKSSESNIFA